MAHVAPKVLILGHSFVRRLRSDLHSSFDPRALSDFGLSGSASVHLFGVGGRTAPKLRSFDLHVIETLAPDVLILEVGSNDLSCARPEVVGSDIDDLVRFILSNSSVKVLGVCHVIPRGASFLDADQFVRMAAVLNNYVSVVLETLPSVFCWTHRDFTSPLKDLYLPDGVHLNPTGQYLLYRSYRGAILHALRSL